MIENKEVPRESPTGNSFIQAFADCPKKWAFKYLMQWVPDKKKTAIDYLVFGQAFHLFKEWFYNNPGKIADYYTRNEEGPLPILEGEKIGIEYLREYGSSFTYEVNIELKERLEKAIDIWLDKYGKTEHERYEVIGTELENVLTLPNGFKITVRYDALLKDKETGYVYIFDTKTTRASLTDTIEKYRYSSQPFIYCASVMLSDYSWKDDFRGWITDAIFQRKYVKDGWKCQIQRSESVFYSNTEVTELLKSMTLITDEMMFCTDGFLNDDKLLGESFRMDRSKCYQRFSGLCPYYHDCMKIWSKNDIEKDPPENYNRDKWSGFNVIQNNLSGIFKNETETIT